MKKTCPTCHKMFIPNCNLRNYCSKECSGKYNRGKTICYYCSREFSKRNNSSKFCSRFCFFSWRKSQNNSPTEKKCCGCKEIKSIVLFSLAQTRKDGRQTLCKVCKSEVNKKNYYSKKK